MMDRNKEGCWECGSALKGSGGRGRPAKMFCNSHCKNAYYKRAYRIGVALMHGLTVQKRQELLGE